ncbi:MAG: hypothetical protein J6S85_09855 [Methanobrevibacter sp.]|nr:hypothetical protein [Methanobrevibacter sp.]
MDKLQCSPITSPHIVFLIIFFDKIFFFKILIDFIKKKFEQIAPYGVGKKFLRRCVANLPPPRERRFASYKQLLYDKSGQKRKSCKKMQKGYYIIRLCITCHRAMQHFKN